MGAVASVVLPLVALVGGLVRAFRGGHVSENPVIEAIKDNADNNEKIEQAENARRKAERDAELARDQQAEAEQLAEQAKIAANEAIAAQKQAEDDVKKAKAEAVIREQEAIAREEAAIKALNDAAIKSQEDAKKVETARDDAFNAKMAQTEAENRADAARKDVETAKGEAESAKMMQAEAKRLADAAEKEANEAKVAKEKAERDLKDGVQPVEWPTRRELNGAKKAHQYKEGLFHFAIAGVAGAGKSSLINAFRGVSNKDPRAAGTGIVETTAKVARYPDPNPENPFVWYDVPGAGTLNIPDWRYFNEQGLYIFDCIIVLFDNRFTATDVAILKNCERFNIPSYIVRSKSNQHIRNILADMEHNSEDEDDENRKLEKRAELLPRARAMFIKESRKTVKANLEKAQLSQKRVYLISKDDMLTVIKGKVVPKKFIDEYDLLRDILTEAKERRLQVGSAA
jgi:chemotaxis protein histidine kinase CheA